MSLTVTVCAPLSVDARASLSSVLAALDDRVDVCHEAGLLPPQRFPADHQGELGFRRDAAQERRWRELLAATDVAIGIPGDSPAGFEELLQRAPRLRWVQGTAAGTGEQLAMSSVADRFAGRIAVTSAAGVHAQPLAEFAVFGLLAMAKDLDRLTELGRSREWAPRWPMRMLRGSHVAVLGLGGIGREVCRLLAAFGTTVTGVARTATGAPPSGAERVLPITELDRLLPTVDAVVVTLPGTAETRGLFDEELLSRLPRHAVLVNVGRGSVVDSTALVKALDDGTLRGAVLDVADEEPLPAGSTLWGRDNVILSPHTAALTVDEDERILELFSDNLQRFVSGRPLRNLVEVSRGY